MNKNLKRILAGVLAVTLLLGSVELPSVVNNKFIAATKNDKSLENFMDEVSSLYEEDDLSNMAPDITFSKESENTVVIDDTIMVPVEVLTENTDISYYDIKKDVVEQDNEELVAVEDVAKNTDYEAIKNADESITLSRVYQSKTLIVKSPVQIDTYNAKNVISGYGNLYILKYATEEDTKNAYDKFLKNKNIDSVEIDSLICAETLDIFTEETTETVSEESLEDITETDEITEFSETSVSSENTTINEEETLETLSERESSEEISSESIEEATTEQEEEKVVIPDGVIVAILDSGIDKSNSLFDGRIVDLGLNLSTSGEGIQDDNGHGTSVASVIVKNSDAYLMPIKIANSEGKGTVLSLYLAIQAAIENQADIINVSLTTSSSDLLTSIIHEATEKGIAVVAAAGNQSANVENYAPANTEDAITVSAIDQNYKPASYSNYGSTIDYAAIGTDLEVETLNGIEKMSGTSLSAAYVSAVLAYAKENDKSFGDYVYTVNGASDYYGKGIVSFEKIDLSGMETVDIEDFDFKIKQSLLTEADRDNYRIEIITNAKVEYTFDGGETWQKSNSIEINRNVEFYDENEYMSSIRTLGIKGSDGKTLFKNFQIIDCNNPKDSASQEIDLAAAGMTETTTETGNGYYDTNEDSTTTYNLYNFYYNIADLTAENVYVRVCNTNTSSAQSFSFPSSLYVKYNGTKKTLTVKSLGNGSSKCLTDATEGCITKITIPTSVTAINSKAFYSYGAMTSITFTSTSKVETIGSYAFYKCYDLASVTIPNSVTSIGDYAFSECTSLNTLTIGTGVISIGKNAFLNAPLATKITFNAIDCTTYNNAFKNKQTATVAIGSLVTKIPDYFIYGNATVKTITIPSNCTSIGNYAFYGCTVIKTITIPLNCTSIGNYAFYDCTNLCTAIRHPNCIIGSNAFPLWTYQLNALNPAGAPVSYSYDTTSWRSDINSSYYYIKYAYSAGSDMSATQASRYKFVQDENAHSSNFVENSGMNSLHTRVRTEWSGEKSDNIVNAAGAFTYVPAFEGYLSRGTVISFTLFATSCQDPVNTFAGLRVSSAASGVKTFSSGRFVVEGNGIHRYYLDGGLSTVYSEAGEYANFSNPIIWTRGAGTDKTGDCSAFITYTVTTTGYYKFETFGYSEHCEYGNNWVAFSADTTGVTLPTYTHKLEYDANGGTGAPATQSATNYVDNHIFTISNTKPIRDGYKFLGWSLSQTETSASYFPNGQIGVPANSSKKLYAVWEILPINMDIPVTITWVDKDNEYASRPSKVTLRLMNGTEVVKEAKIVTGDNTAPASTNVWTYKFEDVDMYDSNGKEIQYTVVEGAYEKDGTFVADIVPSLFSQVEYKTPVYGGDNSGLIIVNELNYKPEKPTKDYGVTISGTVTWQDENDKYHFRPDSVIVELYQDGKLYDSIELPEGTTDYKFTGLPMMDSSFKKYTYTIKEKDIDNYEITYKSDSKTTTVEDDFGNTVTTTTYTVDITNTFTPDKETERFSDNQLTMQATFQNESGNAATESDFKKVQLDKKDVNTTIILKQLNLSWEPVNAEEGKYIETYSGYSGNEINLILHGTDRTYANFIPYGKYEIAVQNDNNFTIKDIEELATKNAEFSYENGKYYVTYSYEYEEAKEDLNVNMTLKSWRGYTSKMGINNFFKNSN